MTGYIQISLTEMLEQVGEERVKGILSCFSSPLNKDVEQFLRSKAIEFSKSGVAQTHLIFTSYKGELVLIGYFTLATKFIIATKNSLSKTLQKRILKFAKYMPEIKGYVLTTPLIGQLGKNYQNGYDKLISGDELLKMACDKISLIQYEIGGRYAYLECEDKPKLIEFYKRNGFVEFGKRVLETDERDVMSGTYLIQMLKYFR